MIDTHNRNFFRGGGGVGPLFEVFVNLLFLYGKIPVDHGVQYLDTGIDLHDPCSVEPLTIRDVVGSKILVTGG